MEERFLEFDGKTFQITGLQEGDWDWMKDCLEESFLRSIPSDFDYDAGDVREKALLEAGKILDNPNIRNEIIILREDEKRVGMLWMAASPFQYTGELRGWILQIYVEGEFRGKGLGKVLMSLAEEWTFENGMDRIGLNVGVRNEEAMALYRRLGYDVEFHSMGKRLPISTR